jgi:hypothetical protein
MARDPFHASAVATTPADPDAVYDLLADGATWPDWSPITSFHLDRPGHDGAEGVGAIRHWKTGRLTTVEEVVAADRPTRFAYTIVRCRSVLVRDYRADVTLEPDGSGTRITWSGTFRPLIPGTGRFWQAALARLYRKFVTGLATHAATRWRGSAADTNIAP